MILTRSVSVIAFSSRPIKRFQGWLSNCGGGGVLPPVAYSELSVQFRIRRFPFPVVLCHFQDPTGPEQLQQVADGAHQLPLAADVQFAAQAEAAKTALFLDLSEDRLDDRLA